MGSCFSKKNKLSPSSTSGSATKSDNVVAQKADLVVVHTTNLEQRQQPPRNVQEEKEEEEVGVKKEIFVIKHRKSQDRRSEKEESVVEEQQHQAHMVRTSSCTKEEVDAILIQCGRLSRSNSSGKQVSSSGRKYSGSKRSYDFDHNDGEEDADSKKKVSDEDDEKRQHRQRHRQTGGGGGSSSARHSRSPSSQGRRRRTPSRERERESDQQQRSGSGRRVSRSPGRRSEHNVNNNNGGSVNNKPGKMVSVPASVNNDGIKRISVKRNVDAGSNSRTAASPRSQSPARVNSNVKTSNETQQQPSLSRSSSRKAEHSPYRRNPLSEIDTNTLAIPQSAPNNTKSSNANPNLLHQKQENVAQGINQKSSCRGGAMNNKVVVTNCIEREHQRGLEDTKPQVTRSGNNVTLTTTVVAAAVSGAENQKPQTVTRSRSSRLSRDLDINPEALMNSNPSPSYTALLLEDIQNFHQKSNSNIPSISLPACVSKACSIVEAVADLNSSTSSNLSGAFSEDRKSRLPADNSNNKSRINPAGIRMTENNQRDPFVESEVLGSDDLTEPSFHKYVTMRRGGGTAALEGSTDLDDQESSGSNSFVGGSHQNWSFSSSTWEPTSADSTDRWTSRSNTTTRDQSPLGGVGSLLRSETGNGSDMVKGRKGFTGTRRDNENEKVGIGRGRVGAGKGLHTVSAVGVAAST